METLNGIPELAVTGRSPGDAAPADAGSLTGIDAGQSHYIDTRGRRRHIPFRDGFQSRQPDVSVGLCLAAADCETSIIAELSSQNRRPYFRNDHQETS
jgi:hypothetical protein